MLRSNDGLTLLMSSSDGFCSALSLAPGELGSVYQPSSSSRSHRPSAINVSAPASDGSTPQPSATGESIPPQRKPSSSGFNPSPSPMSVSSAKAPSPSRSNSASSIATQSSFAHPNGSGHIISNPTPSVSNLPSVAASGSSALPSPTPPLTPLHHSTGGSGSNTASFASSVGGVGSIVPAKREGEAHGQGGSQDSDQGDGESEPKRRRIAPTLVGGQETKGQLGEGGGS